MILTQICRPAICPPSYGKAAAMLPSPALPAVSSRSTAIPTKHTVPFWSRRPNANRRLTAKSSQPSGTRRRNSLTVSAGRTDISRRRLTIRMFPTSPATTRMSDRQRCWQSIFPANSGTPPPPILSGTMRTTGRKANRVRRRSHMN